MSSEALKQEIRAALDNTTLARTLGTFCKTYPAKREKAYEGVDFEATRNKISEVKRYAADHVDEDTGQRPQALLVRGIGNDIQADGFWVLVFFPAHEVSDPEVRPGSIPSDYIVAPESQKTARRRYDGASFLIGRIDHVLGDAGNYGMGLLAFVAVIMLNALPE